MLGRLERLALTFMAKKYVAWITACHFLVFGYISGQEWVLITAAIFTLDLATKMKVGEIHNVKRHSNTALGE
jgi:hypothetical protein